jgi:hypothetical protein
VAQRARRTDSVFASARKADLARQLAVIQNRRQCRPEKLCPQAPNKPNYIHHPSPLQFNSISGC